MAKSNGQLVSQYGTLWARNQKNISRLASLGKLNGVYVLCDGSMPMYIGRGRLSRRIRGHQHSKHRGQSWDHFSWFAIANQRLEGEAEALLLRMLPPYLRSLNRQRSKFRHDKHHKDMCPQPDTIKRPHFTKRPKRRR